PPCVRYKPNQWQEITVHIKPVTNAVRNSIFEQWVDGQKTQEITDFGLTFGVAGTSNGIGAYILSPYQTRKDPTQNHAETAIWYDSVIIPSQPIPMLSSSSGSGGGGGGGDVTPPVVSMTTPTAGATVTASVSVSAAASDNVAISSVQFKLDGVNIG